MPSNIPSASAREPHASGRDRLQQMQAEEARKAKQKKVVAILGALLALVIVIVGVMWGVSRSSNSDNKSADQKALAQARDGSFIPTVTSIPVSTFNAVGAGSTKAGQFQALDAGQPMTEDGKPRILYVGAEFCPWCAMERWGFVAALSRFGTFHGLKGELSSSSEGPELSNIQTMTFRDATYESKYIALKTYETSDRDQNPLQKLAPADQALFQKYVPKGWIPWIDWGGQVTGTLDYDARPLLVGKTNTEIADALKDPNSKIAQGVLGSANTASAQICKLTKNQPAAVCDSPGVKAAAKNLNP